MKYTEEELLGTKFKIYETNKIKLFVREHTIDKDKLVVSMDFSHAHSYDLKNEKELENLINRINIMTPKWFESERNSDKFSIHKKRRLNLAMQQGHECFDTSSEKHGFIRVILNQRQSTLIYTDLGYKEDIKSIAHASDLINKYEDENSLIFKLKKVSKAAISKNNRYKNNNRLLDP